MANLDPSKVPIVLVPLLPMAEKWGIGDDVERDLAVGAASSDELMLLVHGIDSVSDDDLYGWLAGPESYDTCPSNEYVALTCLTMAIDVARVRLHQERE